MIDCQLVERPHTSMSIIVITIPDGRKQKFVAQLQQQTKGAVSLVVLQDRPTPTWRARWQRWRGQSLMQLLRAAAYALALRVRGDVRSLLTVFHAPLSPQDVPAGWAAPTLRVQSVNDPAVKQAISHAKPAVVAVWGSGLLQSDTIAPATTALNVHLGISTQYRGAYANQRAVECGDWTNLGATIHHINDRADAGAVVETLPATLYDTPEETFAQLHTTVENRFISLLKALLNGEVLHATTPDLSQSENLRLADWTPERRWRVAQQLRRWQQSATAPVDAVPVPIRVHAEDE